MPPPPKPKSKMTQRRPLQIAPNEENARPYFSGPPAKEFNAKHSLQNDKRPFSMLNDRKENFCRPLKKTHSASQAETLRSDDDDDAASCRGSKVSIPNAELLGESIKGIKSGCKHLIQEQIPTCSPEDDELDLYSRVGKEREGFRTAKSFGHAVAERKKMKKI